MIERAVGYLVCQDAKSRNEVLAQLPGSLSLIVFYSAIVLTIAAILVFA